MLLAIEHGCNPSIISSNHNCSSSNSKSILQSIEMAMGQTQEAREVPELAMVQQVSFHL